MKNLVYLLALSLLSACSSGTQYDLILRQATVYDGSGQAPFIGDVGILGDSIAYVGPELKGATATRVIDAKGKALSPGFVNMLSWANESLLVDGRSLSGIAQGVTLEVMGEGSSMGPFNAALKEYTLATQGDLQYPITWTTLGEYLHHLEKKGISTNVASFVGAETVRAYVLGFENKKANPSELEKMKALVAEAMEEGAMGLGSSLIYAPGSYADTEELIALAEVAGQYGGMYISHLRSEGNNIDAALNELLRIAREGKVPAEIYHLKMAGKDNWQKLPAMLYKIDSARALGLSITANMYNYTAGATGLDAAMPTWVQEGGLSAWRKRLQDPQIRKKVGAEMQVKQKSWENLCLAAGPDKSLLIGFKQDSLKKYTGKTLSEVAALRGKTWYETAMDLVVQDDSRVGVVYYLMDEENVKKQMVLPYMTFGSDASSLAPEGVFLKSNVHPRAYGNFTRLLAKYVRDEKVMPLQTAIYKLSHLPCTRLKITNRGLLKVGYKADMVLFDLSKLKENSTYADPHHLSEGVAAVWVNGEQVWKNGKHTGLFPGKFVAGPGKKRSAP
jgi:N-acyl-D-amino-acid deacylase